MAFGHEKLDVIPCRDRIGRLGLSAMLTKLGNRGYSVREEAGEYRTDADDTDTDPDTDTDTDTEEDKRGMSIADVR